MKIFDMRLRPPFGSIARGMFGNPGRELFEPEVLAPRFGMTRAESARLCSMELFIREMDEAGICAGAVLIRKSTGMDNHDLAEYRQMINTDKSTWVKKMLSHIGYVAWGGCGFMGPTPGKIEGVLPNLGLGLRIEVQPRMNVRLDFGRDMVNKQNLFYFNMTEAF